MKKKIFSDEKVNTGRQPELDLLKALCIFGMIVCHVMLDLGDKGLPDGFFGDYSTEFFGAATFMMCMGIGMQYTRSQSPKNYYIRGFALLTMGQFLNILRNAVPNLIAWWITKDNFFIANAFLILQADILTFAGLSFFLMGLFKQLKLKDSVILAISVLMSLAALILWKTVPAPESYFVNQMVGFFIITDAESYFPLLCYFIFVACGYFVGGYYLRCTDKNAAANRILLICLPIAAVYYVFRFALPMSWLPELGSDLQYNMKPTPDAVATCLFTLCVIAFLYKVTRLTKDKLPKCVTHMSKHINEYYCISYLFILPVQTILIATTGSLMPTYILPILYSLFVTAACAAIIEYNARHKDFHLANLRGKSMIIFMVVVWVLTIAIAAYSYPRITEYANIWNDYLLP